VMCQYIRFLTEVPRKLQAEGELSTDEWKRVIDQVRRYSLITFTGGEPWLRRDFEELFTHACKKHLVHCITNGTLLRDDLLDRVIELAPRTFATKGWFFVGVSLDGLDDVHDTIRAQKGAFERSVNSIRGIVQRKKDSGRKFPLIHVTAVVQNKNLAILPEMPPFLKDIGVDVFNLATENRSVDDVEDKEPVELGYDELNLPVIDAALLRETFNATIEAGRKAGIELRLPRMPLDDVVNYYNGGINVPDFQCRVPWNTLSIDHRGNANPCYLETVGNVREQTLKEIWAGPKLQNFRTGCKDGLWPACQGCCEMEHRGPAKNHGVWAKLEAGKPESAEAKIVPAAARSAR
jgi:MoaA/NifB/PqqE/SkfB family radical SAM enzyme